MFLSFLLSLLLAGLNVNTASATELESLPGIGPSKAAAIVDYREANGPFGDLADLDKVPGIGPATLENIASEVEFGGELAVAAPPTELSQPLEAPVAAHAGPGVNINVASESQLQSLPGIGPAKAMAIVEDREANGPFASCQDLTRVNGIGDATVKTMGADCTVE